jgi:hypothetical protein
MKTALKIIGGIIGVLAIAVAAFYFGWLHPPAADDVCQNVDRIAKADFEKQTGVNASAVSEVTKELHDTCMRRAENAPEFGRAIWVKQLKCMRDASDMSQLKACDEIKSM